jgi:hypothetical protein
MPAQVKRYCNRIYYRTHGIADLQQPTTLDFAYASQLEANRPGAEYGVEMVSLSWFQNVI